MANTKKVQQEENTDSVDIKQDTEKSFIEFGKSIYTKIHEDENSKTYISNLPVGVVIMYISTIPNSVYIPGVRYSLEENKFVRI